MKKILLAITLIFPSVIWAAGDVTIGQNGTGSITIQAGSVGGGGGVGDTVQAGNNTMTGANTFTGPITVTSTRTYYNATGDFGVGIGATPQTTSAAYMFDVSNSTSNGVTIFDNSTKGQGGGNMLTLISTNTGNHAFNMRIIRNNGGNSNGDIRVDAPNPNFEFIDTTQDGGTSDWGKYEVPSINSDHCNITGRNAANTAFENIAAFNRFGSAYGGGLQLWSGASLKFTNTAGSYVGFKPLSPFTDVGSILWTLPATFSNAGQIMMQTTNSPDYTLAFTTGGTNGQVLTKNNNSAVWTTVTSGGGGSGSSVYPATGTITFAGPSYPITSQEILAAAGLCQASNGCVPPQQYETATSSFNYVAAVFQAGTTQYWQSNLVLPGNYVTGSTFTFKVGFMSTATATTNWKVDAVCTPNGGTSDTAWGTAVTVSTGSAANTFNISQESAALTPAGSCSSGNQLQIRLYRNGDPVGDAYFRRFVLYYQKNSVSAQ